jgi:hypothetical protein
MLTYSMLRQERVEGYRKAKSTEQVSLWRKIVWPGQFQNGFMNNKIIKRNKQKDEMPDFYNLVQRAHATRYELIIVSQREDFHDSSKNRNL